MKRSWFAAIVVVLGSLAAMLSAAAQQSDGGKFALLIGNSNYPDAEAPLRQPIPDARMLADELRRNGFDAEVTENLTKDGMQRALDRLYRKIKPGASAVVFFSGYGIQAGRQTYLIPVNAQIWTEAEVRRDGIGIDTVLAELNARGAAVKVAIIDASRRNPFERRFRGMSSGLAPITAPRGTLIISAAAPGTVINDGDGDNTLFVRELVKELRSPNLTAEEIFNRTRIGVSRVSRGEQVPWISSSLIEDYHLGKAAALARVDAGPPPFPSPTPAPSPAPAATSPSATPSPPPSASPPPPPLATPSPAPPPAAPSPPPLAATPPPTAPPPPAPPPPVSEAPALASDPYFEVRREFEFAERLGSRQGWQDFLAKHKTGIYADLGRQKLEDLGPASPPAKPAPDPAPKVELKPEPPPPPKVEVKPELALNVEPKPEVGLPKPEQPRIEPTPEPIDQAKDPLIRELDQVIARNPNDGDAYYKRGIAYAQKGRFADAIKDFDQTIRLNPRDAEAFNNRCWSRAMLGDLQTALKDCNESLRLKPNFVDALDSRGLVNLKAGLFGGAIADYNAALKVNPKHPSALFGRGKAKLRNGDTAGGNADMAAARAVNRDIAQEFESYGIK